MTISISDIMTKKLETIEEMASVQEAAKKMKDKNVSSLVVVDVNGKPQGLVTERDLVRKVCINDVRTSAVTNKEIMSSPLITIDSNSSPFLPSSFPLSIFLFSQPACARPLQVLLSFVALILSFSAMA